MSDGSTGSVMLHMVDAVILCTDRLSDVVTTVESCLAQTAVDLHVHVVDRNSPIERLRELRRLVEGHSAVTYHTKGYDPGIAGGRNIGTRMGDNPIVIGLEAGTVFDDAGVAARVAQAFAADVSLGALSFRVLDAATGLFDTANWMSAHPLPANEDRPLPTIRFAGAGHAYRRLAFEEAGEFDSRLFQGWEELDLSLRILDRGYWIRYEPSAIVRRAPARSAQDRGQAAHTVRLLARNRIYLARKYPGALGSPRAYALGYLAKGVAIGLPGAVLAGVREGLSMRVHDKIRLRPATLDYLDRHDGVLRGSLLNRLGTGVTIHPAGGVTEPRAART